MFYNLILMTATTIIMRFVAISFNVYVTNKLGAYGMGVFTLITSVGGFAVTLATSGINLASTRMTAEAMGRGSEKAVRQAMRKCLIYALGFGCAAALGLALLAGPISIGILDDPDCTVPLRIMSVSLPCISLSSAMYGYFNAQRRVVKSAAAQMFEQTVKIGVTVAAISALAPRGTKYACIAVIAGGTVSECASFIFSFIMYRIDLARHVGKNGEDYPRVSRSLFGIALPIAFTAYVRSGLVTVEHLLIPWGLKRSGNSSERALASYGVLHGMVFPVILFPMTVMSAFAGLLVPELSECQARGEEERIEHVVSRVFQAALAFSCGCAGIMLCFSDLLGEAIYHNPESGTLIKILAPLIPVMYLDHVVDGMLKGLGEQLYSMKVNIADALASVVLVYFLVPAFGVYGYVFIVIAMEIINASLSTARLIFVAPVEIEPVKWLVKPLLCVAGATSAVSVAVRVLPDFPGAAPEAVFCVAASALLYCLLLRMTGGVSASDVAWLKRAVK